MAAEYPESIQRDKEKEEYEEEKRSKSKRIEREKDELFAQQKEKRTFSFLPADETTDENIIHAVENIITNNIQLIFGSLSFGGGTAVALFDEKMVISFTNTIVFPSEITRHPVISIATLDTGLQDQVPSKPAWKEQRDGSYYMRNGRVLTNTRTHHVMKYYTKDIDLQKCIIDDDSIDRVFTRKHLTSMGCVCHENKDKVKVLCMAHVFSRRSWILNYLSTRDDRYLLLELCNYAFRMIQGDSELPLCVRGKQLILFYALKWVQYCIQDNPILMLDGEWYSFLGEISGMCGPSTLGYFNLSEWNFLRRKIKQTTLACNQVDTPQSLFGFPAGNNKVKCICFENGLAVTRPQGVKELLKNFFRSFSIKDKARLYKYDIERLFPFYYFSSLLLPILSTDQVLLKTIFTKECIQEPSSQISKAIPHIDTPQGRLDFIRLVVGLFFDNLLKIPSSMVQVPKSAYEPSLYGIVEMFEATCKNIIHVIDHRRSMAYSLRNILPDIPSTQLPDVVPNVVADKASDKVSDKETDLTTSSETKPPGVASTQLPALSYAASSSSYSSQVLSYTEYAQSSTTSSSITTTSSDTTVKGDSQNSSEGVFRSHGTAETNTLPGVTMSNYQSCCICRGAESVYCLLDCGHRCLCSSCYNDLCKQANKEKKPLQCPICRSVIVKAIPVYFAGADE